MPVLTEGEGGCVYPLHPVLDTVQFFGMLSGVMKRNDVQETQRGGTAGREGTPARKKKGLSFYVLYSLAWLGVFYLVGVGVRTARLYERVRSDVFMSGGLYEADDRLGFSAVPNAAGTLFFPSPPHVPVRYDEHGFRVPVEEKRESSREDGLLLSLGCSFTEGFACRAENTYPVLLGERLGYRVANAALGAYGMSQMLLQARQWIPRLEPDLVVVQYSPWLVPRSLNEYAPNDVGKRPQPYFYCTEQGDIRMHGPVFDTVAFRYPVARYRDLPDDWLHKIRFFFAIGLPFHVENDVNVILFRAKQVVGLVPVPCRDSREEILRTAYEEIRDLCVEHGARMVIAILAHPWDTPRRADVGILETMEGAVVVDSWEAIQERLPDREPETYSRAYAHYRGDPPVLVDGHPNARAHERIAESLERGIRRSGTGR